MASCKYINERYFLSLLWFRIKYPYRQIYLVVCVFIYSFIYFSAFIYLFIHLAFQSYIWIKHAYLLLCYTCVIRVRLLVKSIVIIMWTPWAFQIHKLNLVNHFNDGYVSHVLVKFTGHAVNLEIIKLSTCILVLGINISCFTDITLSWVKTVNMWIIYGNKFMLLLNF